MNGAERRRKSRELEKQGLARVTIVVSLERVGDMLREARLIDPLATVLGTPSKRQHEALWV